MTTRLTAVRYITEQITSDNPDFACDVKELSEVIKDIHARLDNLARVLDNNF